MLFSIEYVNCTFDTEVDVASVDFDMKGFKEMKRPHQILASLKGLNSNVDGFRGDLGLNTWIITASSVVRSPEIFY